MASPLVVGHRMARIMRSSPSTAKADFVEMSRMVTEKNAAFGAAWFAVYRELMRTQVHTSMTIARSLWAPWTTGTMRWAPAIRTINAGAVRAAEAGLNPIRQKVVANARRLAGKRANARR
jgi:hypothetical protein